VPPGDIASAFFPARGLYSSSNPRVVAAQMAEIATAGVGEVVTSWWGRGSYEDGRLPEVLAAARARGLAVAGHLEPYAGRTIETVRTDLAYLRGLGIRDVYVYRAEDVAREQWAALNAGPTGMRLFAQTTRPGFAAAGRFAGVYTYDVARYGAWEFSRLCTQAHAAGLLCAPSVGPGYDARRCTGDGFRKPRRRGDTYDRMWIGALRARPDVVTITSYNEWGEGTQIEPARWHAGARYRDYAGAYGLQGAAAANAYLLRTAHWTRAFAKSR
jgi:hypothetical protein